MPTHRTSFFLAALLLITLLEFRAGNAQSVEADTTLQVVRKPASKRLRALLDVGQRYAKQRWFYEAEAYFQEAIRVDPQCAEAYYYLGECQRHQFRYAEALEHYRMAQRLDENLAEAEFYHALMLKYAGAYRAAQQSMNDFISRYQTSDRSAIQQLTNRAQNETRGIAQAYRLLQQSSPDFAFRRLPSPVNSPFHDFGAHPWRHDSSLVVSSARRGTSENAPDEHHGAYFSDFLWFEKQAQWQDQPVPKALAAINSRMSEGSGAFDQTRNHFYFTACDQDSTCRIMRSSLVGETWTDPVALSERVNAVGYNAKHPALSPRGDTLYFASDRPGGYGRFDVWMSGRSEGEWQPPTNLGAPINTAFEEVSPAYYEDEQTLVFSSNAPIGLGGYDLYAAYGTTVTNLGYPFNSSRDDWYLRLGERQAFLTSNRDNEDGNFDVYTFRIQADTIHALARLRPELSPDWYEVQFATADLFSEAEFYHHLPYAEKAKVNQYVNRRAFQEVLSEQLAHSGTEQYRYEALSERDQQLVQRLARAKKQFLRREPVEDLSVADQRYFEQLTADEREKIAYLTDEQLFKMLLQEQTTLDPGVAYFYEALPAEDRQKIDRAIMSQRTFYQQTLAQRPTLEDLFHYQSLPAAEKAELDRMIVAQQFLEKVWNTQSPSEEVAYVYESLSLAEQQQVDRYVRQRSFQQAAAERALLSEPEQHYYEALTAEEKESIGRLARAKKQFLLKETTDELSSADREFYERLPADEQEMVARLVDAQVFSLLSPADAGLDPEAEATFAQLPLEDQKQIAHEVARRKVFHQRVFTQLPTTDEVFVYQTLSEEEKGRVGRLANARQFTPREPSVASLDEEAQHFYEALPRSDQESIRRLVTQRKRFLTEEQRDTLSAEDQYFLTTLASEEKQLVRRIIDAWVFDEILTEEVQATELAFRYQRLSNAEKRRVDRLAQSRRLFNKLPEVDRSTSPDRFYAQTIAENVTERVSLSGQITADQGTFPAKVFLVNRQSDTLATAPVDGSGRFTFVDIAYQESDRIAFQREQRSFVPRPGYRLAELTIVPLAEPAENASPRFGNIYFATNRFSLPSGATATLDSLVEFHRQHPRVPIEIRAFADSTGTRRYNEQLTQRRARSVQRYLLVQGVDPQHLSELAMGSVAGDDLAFCRRVELVTGPSSVLPRSAQSIYIIQAQPDLQQIADRYDLSLETLRKWNGGKASVPPYTPVRVIPGAK